jgi:tRNA (adenine57-N1/adenine58-N1)-methyltransferase
MYETLLRPHDVSNPAPLTPIGAIAARLKEAEQRREQKRLLQIANAQARNAEDAALKRKRDDDEPTEAVSEAGHERPSTEVDAHAQASKRTRKDPEERDNAREGEVGSGAEVQLPSGSAAPRDDAIPAVKPTTSHAPAQNAKGKANVKNKSEIGGPVVSKVFAEVRGHTSYLTFASLVPQSSLPGEDLEVKEEVNPAPPSRENGNGQIDVKMDDTM